MNALVLKIGKKTYPDWPSVHIHRSMNKLSGAWGVMGSDIFRGDANAWDIRMGDPVIVEIDEQKVAVGYLEDLNIDYQQDDFTVEIKGRDKTGDLVDCPYAVTPNEWGNQPIFAIIKNLVNPFGVEVAIESGISSRLNRVLGGYRVDIGMTVCESIIDLCNDNGILPLCYPDGKLTLASPTTTKKSTDRIELGGNAVRGLLNQSDKDRFSEYHVYGQCTGSDTKQLADYIEPYNNFSDLIVSRYRPAIFFADKPTDSGKCLDRARREAKIRAGQSRAMFYQVLDWVQSDGKVWEINTLVDVYDIFLGINKAMLIYELDFVYHANDEEFNSPTTLIGVIDPDAYNFISGDIKIRSVFDR